MSGAEYPPENICRCRGGAEPLLGARDRDDISMGHICDEFVLVSDGRTSGGFAVATNARSPGVAVVGDERDSGRFAIVSDDCLRGGTVVASTGRTCGETSIASTCRGASVANVGKSGKFKRFAVGSVVASNDFTIGFIVDSTCLASAAA